MLSVTVAHRTVDREIQRFAARHKIDFIGSEDFTNVMEQPRRRDVNKKIEAEFDPNWVPSEDEVNEWEQAFAQAPSTRQQSTRRAPDTDPNLSLATSEIDEWEKLFTQKQKNAEDQRSDPC